MEYKIKSNYVNQFEQKYRDTVGDYIMKNPFLGNYSGGKIKMIEI